MLKHISSLWIGTLSCALAGPAIASLLVEKPMDVPEQVTRAHSYPFLFRITNTDAVNPEVMDKIKFHFHDDLGVQLISNSCDGGQLAPLATCEIRGEFKAKAGLSHAFMAMLIDHRRTENNDPISPKQHLSLSSTVDILPATAPIQVSADNNANSQQGWKWPTQRFTALPQATKADAPCEQGLFDQVTGLAWTAQSSSRALTAAQRDGYIQGLNREHLCGYHQWRLPSVLELQSLLQLTHASDSANWLNQHGFSGVQASTYWSSTLYPDASDPRYWKIRLSDNIIFPFFAESNHYLLAVHHEAPQASAVGAVVPRVGPDQEDQQPSKASWPADRFSAFHYTDASGQLQRCDQAVYDQLTGLMWLKDGLPTGSALNWPTAVNTANALDRCGFRDWRLPNLAEMRSLVNHYQPDSADWLSKQYGFQVQSELHFWTANGDNFTDGVHRAYCIDMHAGYTGRCPQSSSNQMLAVRRVAVAPSLVTVAH